MGIPSGNKLTKTIWYPHMRRCDILTCEDLIFNTFFVSLIVPLKFVGIWPKHLRIFFGRLPQSSEKVRKCSEYVKKGSSGLRNYFRKSLESGRKSSENRQNRCHQHGYINRGYYLPARGYEFHLRVVNSISHEWAQRTSEISSWPREDKIHIHKRACNILFII